MTRYPKTTNRIGRLASVAKSAVAALVLLAALAIPAAPTAWAMEGWCEDDPPVLITTPGGRLVVVYVTNGALGVQHLLAAQLAHITHTVKPVESGRATRVTMEVTVPNDLFGSNFPTKSTVSSGPFKTLTIYATAMGTSGSPMRMEFTLPVP